MNRLVNATIPLVTFEEFCVLVREDQKADLLDGVIYMASPEGTQGNRLEGWLIRIIAEFVEEKDLGELFFSRIAFRLDEHNAPEPDVAFVSKGRLASVLEGRVDGPPDLAVEIVSPESVNRDYELKKTKYEDAGVREYWIIDPLKRKAALLRLDRQGRYKEVRPRKGILSSQVLPGFWLKLEWLWQDPRLKPRDVLNEILREPS